MFKKSTLPKWEHILLTLANSAIPLFFISVVAFALISPGAYREIFYPEQARENNFQVLTCYTPSPIEVIFRLVFVATLIPTSAAVLYKRISLSRRLFFIPLFLLLLLCLEKFERLDLISRDGFMEVRELNSFFPFQPIDVFFLSTLIFLFLWQSAVVIQDRNRFNKLNLKLP